MSFVRLPCRLWMVALAGVLSAGGFGFSLAFTGAAAALEVPTITTSLLPVPAPVPTVTAPLPTPTVTAPTPSVPVPTPTLPALTPTLPAPTPTVPAPPTPTVSVPGGSVPTSPSAPAPVTSSPGSLSGGSPTGSVVLLGSGGTDPGGASGSSVAGGSAAAPISRSGGTTRGIRVTNVPGRKGAVRIVFRLARPGRVVVIVRGPLPDCSPVARFVIQGRRGENELRFNARTGRRLAEGSYLVGLRPVRAALTRWGALLIDGSGARALTRSAADSAVAHCSSAPVAVTPFTIGFLAGTEREDTLPVGGREGAAGRQGGSGRSTAVERPRRAGVLGVQQIDDAVDRIHPAVGVVFLALVIGSLLGIVYLVVSFLRGEGIARPRL